MHAIIRLSYSFSLSSFSIRERKRNVISYESLHDLQINKIAEEEEVVVTLHTSAAICILYKWLISILHLVT